MAGRSFRFCSSGSPPPGYGLPITSAFPVWWGIFLPTGLVGFWVQQEGLAVSFLP